MLEREESLGGDSEMVDVKNEPVDELITDVKIENEDSDYDEEFVEEDLSVGELNLSDSHNKKRKTNVGNYKYFCIYFQQKLICLPVFKFYKSLQNFDWIRMPHTVVLLNLGLLIIKSHFLITDLVRFERYVL
jgi:hypothetical protein